MRLKSLHISLGDSWEKHSGKYAGTITTTSPTGEVTINLTDESCARMLEVAAQGIKDAASETARFLANSATQLTIEGPQS